MLLIGEKGKLFSKGDYCETGYKLLGDTPDVNVEIPMPLNHFVELARAIQGGREPTEKRASPRGDASPARCKAPPHAIPYKSISGVLQSV